MAEPLWHSLDNRGFFITSEDGSKLTVWPGEDRVFIQLVDKNQNILYAQSIDKDSVKKMLGL